jgi:two-component system sensor histidine kinase UhpB
MDSSVTSRSAGSFFDGPFSSVLWAVHEAIVMVDEAQRIVALNPAAEALLGCRSDEVLGSPLERFVPLPWREAHRKFVADFARNAAAPRAMAAGRRVEVLRSNGEVIAAQITLSRVSMGDGATTRQCHAVLMRDLREEQALEARLVDYQRRMRAVFELSPLAIWICDDERLIYANRATARLFGAADLDQLLGRSVLEWFDAGSHETLRGEVARALAGERAEAPATSVVVGRLLRPDGGQREVEIALAALPDHGRSTVQMVINDVTDRRAKALELEGSRRLLRKLSASVVEAREEERRRIARELHDELGQRLTALKIDLANLADSAALSSADPRVANMSATIDDTLASVRRIASDLRPLMLDDLGLNAAIEWLAEDTSRRIGIDVQAHLPPEEPALDHRVAIALYRMVQEALTNVARHARASEVTIELRSDGEALLLSVVDDGVGLAEGALQRSGSFGLLGLRERAHMLGGDVQVSAEPGGGTRLSVRVPPQPAPQEPP